MLPEFKPYNKIPRLSREIIITEKIDGTNAGITIADDLKPFVCESGREVPFLCSSRTRWVFPESDNHGFVRWAYENAEELLKLGPGTHFGEWWGQGIQRGYGLKEKRFSLFNVGRWYDSMIRPKCCYHVPILYSGLFDTNKIEEALVMLKTHGSYAVDNFMKPEGIVIFHIAGNLCFKKTCEKDESRKGDQ